MEGLITTLRINGIDTDYKITSNGHVYTKKGDRQKATEINKNGYEKVAIMINGKAKLISVHRAMYESFIGDIPKGFVINHIDGNKINNHLMNLEAVTVEENNQHAWRIGLNKPQKRDGTKNPNAKHNERDALAVYALLKHTELSNKEIAECLQLDAKFVKHISEGEWSSVTHYNPKEIKRNYCFSKKEELVLWYLYSVKGYRNAELKDIMGIPKASIGNKLNYIKRKCKKKMDKKIKDPKVLRLVDNYLIKWSVNKMGANY